MKIEIGKRYVRRDGSVTKPLEPDFMDTDYALDPDTQFVYGTHGEKLDHQVFSYMQMAADLVEEYTE
jgi:hypothetical protein